MYTHGRSTATAAASTAAEGAPSGESRSAVHSLGGEEKGEGTLGEGGFLHAARN